jgi:hypothetical protein
VLFIRLRIAIADAGSADSAVVPAFAVHSFETVSADHSLPKTNRPGKTPHEKTCHTEQSIRHRKNHDITVSSTNTVIEAADRPFAVRQCISAPPGGIGQASSIFAVTISTPHSDLRSIIPPVTGIVEHSPVIPSALCARRHPGARAVGYQGLPSCGDRTGAKLLEREDHGRSQEIQGAVRLFKSQ